MELRRGRSDQAWLRLEGRRKPPATAWRTLHHFSALGNPIRAKSTPGGLCASSPTAMARHFFAGRSEPGRSSKMRSAARRWNLRGPGTSRDIGFDSMTRATRPLRFWPCRSTMMTPLAFFALGDSPNLLASCQRLRARPGCGFRFTVCLLRCRGALFRLRGMETRSHSSYRRFSRSHSLSCSSAIENSAARNGIAQLALQGYTPWDEARSWIILGLAADPGVLEVNLPACSSWHEYAEWIEVVTTSCEAAGLRSWKESTGDFPQGRVAATIFSGVGRGSRRIHFSTSRLAGGDSSFLAASSVAGLPFHRVLCGRLLASSTAGRVGA